MAFISIIVGTFLHISQAFKHDYIYQLRNLNYNYNVLIFLFHTFQVEIFNYGHE